MDIRVPVSGNYTFDIENGELVLNVGDVVPPEPSSPGVPEPSSPGVPEPSSPAPPPGPDPLPNMDLFHEHLQLWGRYHYDPEWQQNTWEGYPWYYDGTWVAEQHAKYTGNPDWLKSADMQNNVYRPYATNGAGYGFRIFPHGLYAHWLRTGEPEDKQAIIDLANNSAFVNFGGGERIGLVRETAYVLQAYIYAEKVGYKWELTPSDTTYKVVCPGTRIGNIVIDEGMESFIVDEGGKKYLTRHPRWNTCVANLKEHLQLFGDREEYDVWTPSAVVPGFVGPNYLYTTHRDTKMSYAAMIPTAGTYDVYITGPAHPTYSPSVPVDVVHEGGTTTIMVDQTVESGSWYKLGSFDFDPSPAGPDQGVVIRTEGTTGYVIADAVSFVTPGSSPFGGITVDSTEAVADPATKLYDIERFMFALAAHSLWEYNELVGGDPEVLPLIKKMAEELWQRAWVEDYQAFQYLPTSVDANGNPVGADDLNLQINYIYALMVQQFPDEPVWKERYIKVWNGGVLGAWLKGGKQYTHNHRTTFLQLEMLGYPVVDVLKPENSGDPLEITDFSVEFKSQYSCYLRARTNKPCSIFWEWRRDPSNPFPDGTTSTYKNDWYSMPCDYLYRGSALDPEVRLHREWNADFGVPFQTFHHCRAPHEGCPREKVHPDGDTRYLWWTYGKYNCRVTCTSIDGETKTEVFDFQFGT